MRGARKVLRPSTLTAKNLSTFYFQGSFLNFLDSASYAQKMTPEDTQALIEMESGGFIGLQNYLGRDSKTQAELVYSQQDYDEMVAIESVGRPELVRWMEGYDEKD